MFNSPLNISPLSPKRSGVGVHPLISTMKHEWYFNNVQNASADIITIPDTGTVGGLDIANPALANKPTQSSIGTKISYAADGLDDYMYKATTNFMKGMPTWMITVVCKYNSSNWNVFISTANETNINTEGVRCVYNTTTGRLELTFINSLGVQNTLANVIALVNGNDYIFTFAYDGTNAKIYLDTTERTSAALVNPFSIPTQTDNISTMAIIRPGTPSGNFYGGMTNVGYIGVDEFDLTRLNANVTTLKSTFGI